MKLYFFSAFLIVFLSSCASTYRSVDPKNIGFYEKKSNDSIDFSYKYRILDDAGNKKYAKRQDLKSTQLVAFKITNNTKETISYGTDFTIFKGDYEVPLIDTKKLYANLKQGELDYLLFFLLGLANGYRKETTTVNGRVTSEKTEFIPIGIIIGPILGIGNLAYANSQNAKFLKELNENDISKAILKPGETRNFLVGLSVMKDEPLKIGLKK